MHSFFPTDLTSHFFQIICERDNNEYIRHVKQHRAENITPICQECGASFETAWARDYHVRLEHKEGTI